MGAVYEKELKQYFCSMIGTMFFTTFVLLVNYYFVVGNLFTQNGNISVLFRSILMTVIVLCCPMLTMRLFAEEKKMRTDQMLFTAPISLRDVVLGKFLACWSVFLLASTVILLNVAILAFYGCFQLLITLGNLVGLWLASAAFLSIGMFLSSLTENQIVAAILTYGVLLGLWLVDFLQDYTSNPILLGVIRYLSYRQHFHQLAFGLFRLSTLFYFAGTCLLFLALTVTGLEQRRNG